MTFKLTSYSIRNYGTHTSEELNLIARQKPAALAIRFPCVNMTPFPRGEKKKLNHNSILLSTWLKMQVAKIATVES